MGSAGHASYFCRRVTLHHGVFNIFSCVIAVSHHASYFFKCKSKYVYHVLNVHQHGRTATFHPSRQSYFNKSWTTELELEPGQNGTAPQHWQQPFKCRNFFVVSPDNESLKKNSQHRVTCRFFAFASMMRYREP